MTQRRTLTYVTERGGSKTDPLADAAWDAHEGQAGVDLADAAWNSTERLQEIGMRYLRGSAKPQPVSGPEADIGVYPTGADVLGKAPENPADSSVLRAYQYAGRPALNLLPNVAKGVIGSAQAVLGGAFSDESTDPAVPSPLEELRDSIPTAPDVPGLEGGFGSKVGDLATFGAAVVASGGALGPAMATTLGAGVAGTQGLSGTYQTLTEKGVEPRKALAHAAVAAGVDAGTAIVSFGRLSKPLASSLLEALKSGAIFGTMSAAQRGAQDAIEAHATHEDLKALDELKKIGSDAGAGTVVGFFLGALHGAAESKRAQKAQPTDVGEPPVPLTDFSKPPATVPLEDKPANSAQTSQASSTEPRAPETPPISEKVVSEHPSDVVLPTAAPEPRAPSEPSVEQVALARAMPKEAPIPLAPQVDLKPADLNPVKDSLGRTIVNIGDRLRGTQEDTIGAPSVMERQKVVQAIADAGRTLVPEAGLRMGMVPKGAGGFYSPETQTARIAKFGDMSTAAHEIGHAIENRVLGTTDSPLMEPKRNALVQDELRRLGKVVYPNGAPANGYLSEGWAEFTHMWLMQHEDLMHFAPELTRWHDTEFLPKQPKYAAAMDNARALADTWRYQGSEKRTIGSIARPKTVAQRIADFSFTEFGRKLNREVFSSFEAAKRYEDAKAAMGKPTPKEQRIDNLITAFAGKAEQQAAHFATTGTTDLWGNGTGESLDQAASGMRGNHEALEMYGKSKRTIWLRTEREAYNPVTGEYELAPHDNGQSLEDALATVQKLEAKFPLIGVSDVKVRAWWERVLDYVVEADPTFAQAREAMRQEGEYYVPMKRQFEGKPPMQGKSSGGAARAGKLGERLSEGGSGRQTKPFLTQMQVDATQLMRRAHDRLVLRSLVENGRDAGIGFLMEDVTASHHGEGEGYTIGQEVPPPDVPSASLDSFFSSPTTDASGRAVFKWTELRQDPDGTPRASVRAIAIHPDLFEAISSLNPNDFKTAMGWAGSVQRFARGVKQAVIGGAVVVNPKWTFFKNATYDPVTAWLLSRYSGAFRDLVIDWVPNMVRVGAHELTDGKLKYPWVDAYKSMGANVSAPYQSERRVQGRTAEIGKTLPQRLAKTIRDPRDWYEVVARVMGVTEEAPRIWELKRAAKAVNWEPGQTMTPEQYMEMALATRRITGNRAEAGVATNQLNQYIPFFRSAFVTPRDTVRAATAKGNRLSFGLKAAAAAGLGAIYWAKYGKRKDIKAQDATERMGYATFPITTHDKDGTPIDDAVHIPIAPEVAFFFFSAQMALDAMDGEDGYSGSELAKAYVSAYAPPFIPSIASEPTLQFANKQNFSSEAPIVPEGQEGMKPEEQIGPRTSPVAIAAGKIMGWSPRRIDHAIGSIFGAPGDFALSGFHLIPDPKNAEQTPREVLEGTWLRRGGAVSPRTRWTTQLMTLAQAAEQDYASKNSEWTPQKQIQRETLQEATKGVMAAYAMASTYQMTAKQKQDLYTAANNLAYNTVHAILLNKPNMIEAYATSEQLTSRKKMLDLLNQGPPKNLK